MRRSAAILLVVVIGVGHLLAQSQRLPNAANSVKFAVIGDNGTGDRPEYEVGAQMARARASFAFDTVHHAGRQHVRQPGAGGLHQEVRAAVQGAP